MPTAKITKTKTARAAETVVPPLKEEQSALGKWHESMKKATEDYLGTIDAPNWKRVLASVALGFVSCCAVYYYGCTLLMPAVLTAVMTLTGAGFISFMVSVLTSIALLLASVATYSKVSSFVARTDWAGTFDTAKSTVLGWAGKFRRGEVVHAAV